MKPPGSNDAKKKLRRADDHAATSQLGSRCCRGPLRESAQQLRTKAMLTTPPSASRTGVGVPGRRSAGVASSVAGGAATKAAVSCRVLCHTGHSSFPRIRRRSAPDRSRRCRRATPSRSCHTVRAMRTRLSASSTHSTGTSCSRAVHVAREEQRARCRRTSPSSSTREERSSRHRRQRLSRTASRKGGGTPL